MGSKCPLVDILKSKTNCKKAIKRLGRKGVRGEKLNDELCPWYINSEQHKYCFWVYICDKRNHRGKQLTEIANLLNTSVNNVKLVEVGALEKVRESLIHLNEE